LSDSTKRFTEYSKHPTSGTNRLMVFFNWRIWSVSYSLTQPSIYLFRRTLTIVLSTPTNSPSCNRARLLDFAKTFAYPDRVFIQTCGYTTNQQNVIQDPLLADLTMALSEKRPVFLDAGTYCALASNLRVEKNPVGAYEKCRNTI
jgi:hypothetical protein